MNDYQCMNRTRLEQQQFLTQFTFFCCSFKLFKLLHHRTRPHCITNGNCHLCHQKSNKNEWFTVHANWRQLSSCPFPLILYPSSLPFCLPHLDPSMSAIFLPPCANISQRIWFPIHLFSSHLLQLNSPSLSFVLSHKKIKRQEEESSWTFICFNWYVEILREKFGLISCLEARPELMFLNLKTEFSSTDA